MKDLVTRICSRCGKSGKFGSSGGRVRPWCTRCMSAYKAQWKKENPEAHKAYLLRRVYGISLEQYRDMFNRQEGVCAICKKPEQTVDKRTGFLYDLAVDHCHVTGRVRGLLCQFCNRGLGNFRDNEESLRAAATYLADQRSRKL